VRAIGLHHFAYLRAVAEGLDIAESAARYLGTEHGHEARTAYKQSVDAVANRRTPTRRALAACGPVDQDPQWGAPDAGRVR
jgi:hypothetical protein